VHGLAPDCLVGCAATEGIFAKPTADDPRRNSIDQIVAQQTTEYDQSRTFGLWTSRLSDTFVLRLRGWDVLGDEVA